MAQDIDRLRHEYIPGLDGVRSLAIILVLLRHSLNFLGNFPGDYNVVELVKNPILNFFYNGWMGVDLFFVLSGFLIGRMLVDKPNIFAKDYFIRRARRIFPAYYAILFIVAFGLIPDYPIVSTNVPLSLLSHMVFMQDYTGADLLIVLWSLGVEVKFYLLLPVMLWLFSTVGRPVLTYALMIGLMLGSAYLRYLAFRELGSPHTFIEFFRVFRTPFHACLDPLAMGVLLAALKLHHPVIPVRWAQGLFGLGLLGVACVLNIRGNMVFDSPEPVLVYLPLAAALAYGAMVGGVIWGGGPKILGHKFFVVTATLSYSIYLVHYAFIPLVIKLVGGLGFFACFSLYLVLSVLAATALHIYVEKPFMHKRNRI